MNEVHVTWCLSCSVTTTCQHVCLLWIIIMYLWLNLRQSDDLVCVMIFLGNSKWSPSVPIEVYESCTRVRIKPGVNGWTSTSMGFVYALFGDSRTCECSSFRSLLWTLEGVFLMDIFKDRVGETGAIMWSSWLDSKAVHQGIVIPVAKTETLDQKLVLELKII